MMDPNTELGLLETAYTKLLQGNVKSYKVGDRELTRLDFNWIVPRMDLLRAQIIRQTSGMAFASQFRNPE